MKTCSKALRNSALQQDNDPKHTAKTMQEWLWDKSLNVLEWPSQSLDLNPFNCLWRDLKIAVQQRSPSKLTELERICTEEFAKRPKYRCAKHLASNQVSFDPCANYRCGLFIEMINYKP